MNPQTQFSMEYYKMLMRSSKKQAEAYRLSVTAPKPNAIDVGKTRWVKEMDVALSQDAVITNEQIQARITPLREFATNDQNSNANTQDTIETPIISDNTGDSDDSISSDWATIQPIHEIIGSVDVVGEVMNAKAEEQKTLDENNAPETADGSQTLQPLSENIQNTENSDKLPSEQTPPEWAQVIDVKEIKKLLRENGVTNANFLTEADAIAKAQELNLL